MKHAQIPFPFMKHGGARKNSGRKKLIVTEPAHNARPIVNERTPFHVGVKLIKGLPSLRSPDMLESVLRSIENAKKKGLYVTQFSIESNHIHLVGETEGNDSLTKGMLSLCATITWALRKIHRVTGKIFLNRYFVHAIRMPREMRNALEYVLFNHAKHLKMKFFTDVYSSAHAFADLHLLGIKATQPPRWLNRIKEVLSKPSSWLQTTGWKKRRA